MDFDLEFDQRGLVVDVQYPQEDKPRYSIDLLNMECTCTGYIIEKATARRESRSPQSCKHLQEVEFRLLLTGIRLGRLNVS